MKRTISTIAVIATLSGCASAPKGPQSRAEWEAQHVRTYEGKTATEIQDAAEKLLKLSDKDFTFSYPDGRLVAQRNWSIFMLIGAAGGTDYWTIETAESESGTKATVQITRNQSAMAVGAVAGGPGYVPVTSSTPGQPVVQPAPYELFWKRMDYLLGISQEWVTCKQFKPTIKGTKQAGAIEVLCQTFTSDDNAPET